MIFASIESLVGSIWAVGLALVSGYVAGNIFPISKFTKK